MEQTMKYYFKGTSSGEVAMILNSRMSTGTCDVPTQIQNLLFQLLALRKIKKYEEQVCSRPIYNGILSEGGAIHGMSMTSSTRIQQRAVLNTWISHWSRYHCSCARLFSWPLLLSTASRRTSSMIFGSSFLSSGGILLLLWSESGLLGGLKLRLPTDSSESLS